MKLRRFATFLLYLFALFTMVSLAGRACAAAKMPVETVPGEVLVGIDSHVEITPQSANALFGWAGNTAGYHRALHILRLKLRSGLPVQQAISQLRLQREVVFAEPNYICHLCFTPNDPLYPQQYGPQITQANLSWDIWTPVAQTVVAIVDTGIDTTHPDLTGVLYRDSSGNVIGENTLNNSSDVMDDHGHGTHCAGIAAAHIDNSIGIAGIAGFNPVISGSDTFVKIMPVKVLNQDGNGTDADVANGITWAADHGANVISLSLGEGTYSQTLDSAVQYAWGKGCVIVAAAGNGDSSSLFYPAADNHVISVAATGSKDILATFSQYGSWVEVAAPGSSILSILPTYFVHKILPLNYGKMSGTSMAAPHVAGEAAAILAQNPTLTNDEVGTLIRANVDAYAPYINHFIAPSAGRINVYRAVLAAGNGTPVLTAVALAVPQVAGSVNVTGTVFLGGTAPAQGAAVTLSSSDPAHAPVPQSVTISSGTSSIAFNISTTQVNASTPITITATYNGTTVNASLTLVPIAMYNLAFQSGSVVGGSTADGIVTLNAPAPSGGATIMLSSSDPTHAPVPSSMTVPAGSTSASFSFTTATVSTTEKIKITATFGSQITTAQLTLKP